MNTPDQDPLDVRLSRVVYGRVARRWCVFFNDSGRWEVVAPRDYGDGVRVWQPRAGRHFLLWCYRPGDRWSWAPVPAFGQDGGAMLAALERYAEDRGLYVTQFRVPGGVWQIGVGVVPWECRPAEGSTFALAARAAILAMEDAR